MAISIDTCLLIEVTRRCNLKCAHCLRGPAQSIDFNVDDPVLMHNIFHDIDYIGDLCLTGGELTLPGGYRRVKEIFKFIRQHEVIIENLYVVLNGTRYSSKLLHLINDFACDVVKFDTIVKISNDVWHRSRRRNQTAVQKYERSSDDYSYLYIVVSEPSDYKLIPQGRALNLSGKNAFQRLRYYKSFVGYFDGYCEDRLHIIGDQSSAVVYISSNGNVVTNCNLSYRSADRMSLGNVLEHTLCDIIQHSTVVITTSYDTSTVDVYDKLCTYEQM